MELRQLKTFRVVATLESFNKAALVLNYAQSTVSEQIKSLETSLGVRLFDHTITFPVFRQSQIFCLFKTEVFRRDGP